ncbi:MAG: hypothetical protein LBG57_06630 [Treponema sp.]|jgi:hypothetical protein|nr:hypothetical protein [Treponema sp.]
MLKQSLKFIGIVLLAALLPLMGCQQATDSSTSVFAGKHIVYGSVTPEDLQVAADNARAAGEPLIFAAQGATISAGPGLVDFTGVSIRIEGKVETSGSGSVILDASRAASLILADDGELKLESGDYLIYADGMELDSAGPNDRKVLYTPNLADINGSVSNVAVDEFLVKATVDTDIPAGVENLFVIKKTQILPESIKPNKTIYALGEVELLGDNSVALATAANFVLTSSARLVNGSNGHVSVTVPAEALSIEEIDVGGPTRGITLTGPSAVGHPLTLKKLTGPGGALEVNALIAITIEGGDGDIVIGAGSSITAGKISNKSTGKTTYNSGSSDPVTFPAGDSAAEIAGPVEFTGGVKTIGTGTLIFGDKVILPNNGVITLTAATDTVTLGAGASIVVKDSGKEIPLLEAVDKTVLTPTANLTLTVDSGDKKITQGEASNGTHTLTITSGELRVAPGATYVVPSESGKLGVLAVNGVLSFATDGAETPEIGKLELTGATSTDGAEVNVGGINGKVIAGGAEITGRWQAVSSGTDSVTLSYDGIAADSDSEAFTAIANGSGIITVPAGVTLTIPANTKIDLQNDISGSTVTGKITLKAGGVKGEGGKIVFAANTSVIQVGGSGDTDGGTALTAAGGDFVDIDGAAAGKITVSSFANVKINPGSSTKTKVNSIKVTAADEYIQAYNGEGADGVIAITPVS